MKARTAVLWLAFARFALAAAAGAGADPQLSSWVRTAGSNSVQSIAPEVHAVRADADFVYVESAGLSLHPFGALAANQYDPPAGPRTLTFRIPRHPKPAVAGEHQSAPLGIVGVFVTGVPIYNPIGASSYQNQNIWHQDAVAASKAGTSPLVAALTADAGRHSPLIGFALDGYPIYGPYGWGTGGHVVRMRSSYQLRKIARRTTLPDGTQLLPGQEGPDVSAAYPLGTFAEDYEFVQGSGDLDQFNGRFARTPEYPDGTYAYFLTSWPYLIGPRYYGDAGFAAPASDPKLPAQMISTVLQAGKPQQLRFVFHDAHGRAIRFLEKVHEQPIHMVVVSADLAEFAHIHPELVPGGVYAVTHTFAHGGKYIIFADYTAPGAAPAVARFEVTVAGPARAPDPPQVDSDSSKTVDGVTVTFHLPQTIRAGEDIPVSFDLSMRDLQPWLGAWAHIMLVSADGKDFIHAHPMDGVVTSGVPVSENMPHVHTAPVAGPSPATIHTTFGFRRAGVYKLWLQFQRNGSLVTVPWVMKVAAAVRPASTVSVSAPPAAAAIHVTVSSAGFQPARLTVPANRKTQVAFTRLDAQNCASEVVFPEFGIRAELPPGQTVVVDIPPTRSGEFSFGCGMGMYKGALVVR